MVRLVAFANDIRELASIDQIPEPHGGTMLHVALERAADLMAGVTIVSTDGEPYDKEGCFAAASRIPGIIEVVFVGDDNDRDAIEFRKKLSRDNGGRTVVRDIVKGQSLICSEVRDMLGLPAPIAL